jgi:16S rRNA (guanine527-N7)-methyltransferase
MSAAAPPETQVPDFAGLPAGFLDAVGATPSRLKDVERFRNRLAEANSVTNLVGESTLGDFWRRHFVDSAQLLWVAPSTSVWADLGSGAGLPGLVLAILLKDRPGARVHLIESMAKRCRFLEEVTRALDLPAVVHHARAESLALKVDRVTARACAPLDRLLTYARPYLARGARGLFLKGSEVDAEIAEARRNWRFDSHTTPSLSDPRGRLLSIEELVRVAKP